MITANDGKLFTDDARYLPHAISVEGEVIANFVKRLLMDFAQY